MISVQTYNLLKTVQDCIELEALLERDTIVESKRYKELRTREVRYLCFTFKPNDKPLRKTATSFSTGFSLAESIVRSKKKEFRKTKLRLRRSGDRAYRSQFVI